MEQLDYAPEELEDSVESGEIFEVSTFPDGYRELVGQHNRELTAILEQTLPPELINGAVSRIIFEQSNPTEMNQAYGVDAVASYEFGGTIKIFEGFFEKSYAEQQYILVHEMGHALTPLIFSEKEAYEELLSLNQAADIAGETSYARHMIELGSQGKLSAEAVFSERVAERLAAYLLGGGDVANMLEIQAVYLQEPRELFSAVPQEALRDKDSLRNFLSETGEVNSLIQQTSGYHQLIARAIRQTDLQRTIERSWDVEAVDDSTLGESPFLASHLKHHELPNPQEKSLWSFLFEFLFPKNQP